MKPFKSNEVTTNPNLQGSKQAIIIFTRNPELGKCKTRLAKTIGNEAALNIYKYLLEHTANITASVHVDKFVFYSEQIIQNDLWNAAIFNKKLQQGQNLGERMEHAFVELFQQGYNKIVIVGSDLLDLNSNIVNEAFHKLNHHDVVFGPAKDGGYYLLGLSKMQPCIFHNKPWSEANLLEVTLKELALKNVSLTVLKTLNDIDTFEDMKDYPQLKKFYTKHD